MMPAPLRKKAVSKQVDDSKEKELELQEGEETEAPDEETSPEETPEDKDSEETPEAKEPEVKVSAKAKAMPNVRINPNADHRSYIGDQYYNLKKGKVITVPQNVKEILARAGLLDPL